MSSTTGNDEDDGGDITVIGPLPPNRDTGGGGGGSGGGGGGSGGGKPPSPKPPVQVWLQKDALTAEEEARADALAKQAADLISRQPNYMTTEYAIAIIMLDNGTMVLSPIANGDATSAQPDYGSQITYQGQIVGLIHNHPLGTMYNADGSLNEVLFERNKRPSEQADGDRDGMDKIVRDGGNPLALRYYIIGPDGLMRKYRYDSPRGVNQPAM